MGEQERAILETENTKNKGNNKKKKQQQQYKEKRDLMRESLLFSNRFSARGLGLRASTHILLLCREGRRALGPPHPKIKRRKKPKNTFSSQ